MNKRNIIIIVVVILVLAAVGGYFFLNNGGSVEPAKQSRIILSKSAYMKVPDDANASHHVDKKGVVYYDSENVNVTVCSNISKSSGLSDLKKIKNSVETGAKKMNLNVAVIYLKDGVYSAFIKNSEYNDSILIQSPSKDVLLQCLGSVSFHDPSTKVVFNDTNESSSSSDSGSSTTVIDVVQETESAVGTSYSSGSSESSSSSSDYSSGYEESYTDYYYSGGSSGSSYSSGGSSSGGGGSSSGGGGSLTDYYSQ